MREGEDKGAGPGAGDPYQAPVCACMPVCVCIQRGEGPGPHTPQDPRCGPLCLPTHEIKYVATETHTLGRAQKMRRFGNPVLALKKCWEPEEANKPEASGTGWSRALEHLSHRPERMSLENPEALRGPQGNGPALAKPNEKVTVTWQPAPRQRASEGQTWTSSLGPSPA